jgi:hypothetical protein
MKNRQFLFLAFTLFIILYSCNKEENNGQSPTSPTIGGKWNIDSTITQSYINDTLNVTVMEAFSPHYFEFTTDGFVYTYAIDEYIDTSIYIFEIDTLFIIDIIDNNIVDTFNVDLSYSKLFIEGIIDQYTMGNNIHKVEILVYCTKN